jgi:hypothetical protein
MPGNPRAMAHEAEKLFPVRIVVQVPPGGIGQRHNAMRDWLDENCGVRGWEITPAGIRGGQRCYRRLHGRTRVRGGVRRPMVRSGRSVWLLQPARR